VQGRIAYATVYLSEGNADQAFAQFDEVLHARRTISSRSTNIGRCAAVSGQQLDRGIAA